VEDNQAAEFALWPKDKPTKAVATPTGTLATVQETCSGERAGESMPQAGQAGEITPALFQTSHGTMVTLRNPSWARARRPQPHWLESRSSGPGPGDVADPAGPASLLERHSWRLTG
jgi:hypothetical protein